MYAVATGAGPDAAGAGFVRRGVGRAGAGAVGAGCDPGAVVPVPGRGGVAGAVCQGVPGAGATGPGIGRLGGAAVEPVAEAEVTAETGEAGGTAGREGVAGALVGRGGVASAEPTGPVVGRGAAADGGAEPVAGGIGCEAAEFARGGVAGGGTGRDPDGGEAAGPDAGAVEPGRGDVPAGGAAGPDVADAGRLGAVRPGGLDGAVGAVVGRGGVPAVEAVDPVAGRGARSAGLGRAAGAVAATDPAPGVGGVSPGLIGRSRVVISISDGAGAGSGRRRASVMREVVPGRCSPVIPVPPLVSTMPVTLRAVPPGTGTQGLPTRKPVWQARAMTPRAADRARYDRATAHLDAPVAIVDLEAFDANADDLVRRAGGKPVRVASKSVRCRALLERVLAREGFAGIMSFTLDESLWLARAGFDDVLLAYPSADRTGFGELARDPKLAAAVTVMVDDVAQLDLIDASRAGGTEEVRVCLELDTALSLLGGRIRVGARRSPLREPAQLAELARSVVRRPGFRLVGIMAYEGHVAGVGDSLAGRPLRSRVIRLMQAAARRELAERRAAVVRAVRAVAPDLEFVNGGGTGSVQHTAAEDAVTEIAAGSGLFVPRLFDNYTSFSGRPAALFAQPVVRRPGVGVVTVLGGGYPASGAAGPDRLPVPYLPEGLAYDPQEGPGEVQTPLIGSPADDLRIGDKVWFRHAKAGELCERFASLQLIEGDRITAAVPTYRGEGRTFL